MQALGRLAKGQLCQTPLRSKERKVMRKLLKPEEKEKFKELNV